MVLELGLLCAAGILILMRKLQSLSLLQAGGSVKVGFMRMCHSSVAIFRNSTLGNARPGTTDTSATALPGGTASASLTQLKCIARNERVFARKGEKIRRLWKRRRPKKSLHTYGVLTQCGMEGPFFVEGSITAHRYLRWILPQMLAGVRDIFVANDDSSSWILCRTAPAPIPPTRRSGGLKLLTTSTGQSMSGQETARISIQSRTCGHPARGRYPKGHRPDAV